MCLSGICSVFFLGDPEKALAAYVCIGIIAFAVRYFWDLRKHVWFWLTIASISFFHAVVIGILEWPERYLYYFQHWNHMQALPFALLDFAVIYGIIRLVESLLEEKGH